MVQPRPDVPVRRQRLAFATRFLDLRIHYPRARRAVLGFCAAFGILLGAAMLLGIQKVALLVVFSFAFLFSCLMLYLGAISVRAGQKPFFLAERLAQLDPLTGLNNRRAFYDKTSPLWSQAIRHGHDTVVVLLDINLFKEVMTPGVTRTVTRCSRP